MSIKERQIDIYTLKCPTSKTVCYVGQTGRGKRRMYEHNSNLSSPRYPVSRWVAKLRVSNMRPIYEIIDNVPKSVADEAEIGYILLFRSFGANLYNLSRGGNGNLISENHNSKCTKGKRLEDYYGEKRAEEIRSKISNSVSGKKNPNYGRKFPKEYSEKQKEVQSKKPLIVKDKNGTIVGEFRNSKDAAEFIGCGHSLIREAKSKGYYVRRKYLILDKYENDL